MSADCVQGHSAMIHDRGGVRRIDSLQNLFSVQWGRVEGDKSIAKVVITAQNCAAQAQALQAIEPRRHELVIFRGNTRVWEGPIVEPAWYSDRLELTAVDVLEYAAGTALSKDWPNKERGGPAYMTQRVQQIFDYELSTSYVMQTNSGPVTVPAWEVVDPPINVLPHLEIRPSVGPGGISTLAETDAFQMTLFDHLQALTRSGLDYTVVGRKILMWDSATSVGRTRIITETDFSGDVAVFASGRDFAAISHISAQAEEEGAPPAVGHAGAASEFYGPWEHVLSLDSEEGSDTPDQVALNGQAGRYLVGRNPVPTQIVVPDGASLLLGGDLTIDSLVPGVVMPVRATLNLRPVSQDQRLQSVTVTETSAGETIGIKLIPAGDLEAF